MPRITAVVRIDTATLLDLRFHFLDLEDHMCQSEMGPVPLDSTLAVPPGWLRQHRADLRGVEVEVLEIARQGLSASERSSLRVFWQHYFGACGARFEYIGNWRAPSPAFPYALVPMTEAQRYRLLAAAAVLHAALPLRSIGP